VGTREELGQKILTFFFPYFWRLKTLKITSFSIFLIFNFSIWRDFASQKQRLPLTTLFVTFVSCFFFLINSKFANFRHKKESLELRRHLQPKETRSAEEEEASSIS
jgi:hypothetical protein